MKFVICFATFLLFVVAVVQSKERNDKHYKVVCYFESWASYDKGDAHFAAEDINPSVCTHVNYAFGKLTDNSLVEEDPSLDGDMLRRTVALRKKNPHLTVMISLGGWSEGSTKYSQMAASKEHRHQLVQSVLKFLEKHDLDGLDLDWEYPGFSGVGGGDRHHGNSQDKHNYILLLQELHEAFKPHGYVLTAAVGAGGDQLEHSYDVPAMSKYLDFINLMTYDYHDSGDGATGYNAPLASPVGDHDPTNNIHWTVEHWIAKGADPKKLVLGIPLYGKGYHLNSANDHKVGAKASAGHGLGGNYNKICQQIKAKGLEVHWDEQAQVPYATHGQDWVSFDNAQSVQKKVDYIKQKGLGGSMVWAIDGDDFHGHCGQGKYPLMKIQMKALNGIDVHD